MTGCSKSYFAQRWWFWKGWRFRISVSGVPSGPEMMNTKISEYGNARTGATSREVNIFTVRNTENNCYDTSTPFSPIFPIKRTLFAYCFLRRTRTLHSAKGSRLCFPTQEFSHTSYPLRSESSKYKRSACLLSSP